MPEPMNCFQELYKSLEARGPYVFPKKCPRCGRVYANLQSFIGQTEATLRSSGLVQASGDSGGVVGIFRDCNCGALLVVLCHDRRNYSEDGVRRRESFGFLLNVLQESGVDRETARKEMLKLIRGEESPLLARYGLDPSAEGRHIIPDPAPDEE